MKHTAYFGDGEKTFALTYPLIKELEQKTGTGFGALYKRMASGNFYLADIIETIRLGLIGGGTSPAEAQRLIDAYAHGRPLLETIPLALDVLDAHWTGSTATIADLKKAAATGDLAAAINGGASE